MLGKVTLAHMLIVSSKLSMCLEKLYQLIVDSESKLSTMYVLGKVTLAHS